MALPYRSRVAIGSVLITVISVIAGIVWIVFAGKRIRATAADIRPPSFSSFPSLPSFDHINNGEAEVRLKSMFESRLAPSSPPPAAPAPGM